MATNTVCAGEILQTQHRRDFRFTQNEYFKVLEMKTAELFALSAELSACLSGNSHETRQTLRQFGLAFGTAYQLFDDCVDLFGSEASAGKSLGDHGKFAIRIERSPQRCGLRSTLEGLKSDVPAILSCQRAAQ